MTVTKPPVGRKAPDISLRDTEGHLWELAAHRGRTVVVIFHRHIH